MKTLTKKTKFLFILAFIALVSFIISLYPVFTANAAAYSEPTQGFKVSKIGVDLQYNDHNDVGNTKFVITINTQMSEHCFEQVTNFGAKDISIGVLIGPYKYLKTDSVTDFNTALNNQFHRIENYGTQGSGAKYPITFDNKGYFTFESGVAYNEKTIASWNKNGKTGDDMLFDVASFEIAAIPYYSIIEDGNATPVVNMGDAVSFMAKPHLYEAYVAHTNNNPDAPIVTDYMLKKFVTKNNTVNIQTGQGEYFIDKAYDILKYAKTVGEDVFPYNAVFLMGKNDGDRLYIGGIEFLGETTSLGDRNVIVPIDFIDTAFNDSEDYTYSITLFKQNGSIITANAKCVTAVIDSAGSYLPHEIAYPCTIHPAWEDETGGFHHYTSKFNNPADKDGYPTITYDGYYVMGKDLRLSNAFYSYGNLPTKLDGVHGFTGVFDGRGKAIIDGFRRYEDYDKGTWAGGLACFLTNGSGIFGVIEGGTVKNLAVYNVTMHNIHSSNSTILASLINNATIENVYLRPLSYLDNVKMGNPPLQQVGYLLGKEITNSTLKNVVVENGFLDVNNNDPDSLEYITRHTTAVTTFNTLTNCTLENVFVAGCSPISAKMYFDDQEDYSGRYVGIEIGVTELPLLANGARAVPGVKYFFNQPNNSTLIEKYKTLAVYMGNTYTNFGGIDEDTLSVTFKLVPSEVKHFATLTDMVEYILDENQSDAYKDMIENTRFWRILAGAELTWVSISNDNHYQNVINTISTIQDLTGITEENGHYLTGIVPFN